MTKDDLIFFFDTAAALSGHTQTGPDALSGAQAQVKTYLTEHTDLQDPDVLRSFDTLLKVSSAAQVPGVYTAPPYDPNDYYDAIPEPEPEPIEEPPAAEPQTEELAPLGSEENPVVVSNQPELLPDPTEPEDEKVPF